MRIAQAISIFIVILSLGCSIDKLNSPGYENATLFGTWVQTSYVNDSVKSTIVITVIDSSNWKWLITRDSLKANIWKSETTFNSSEQIYILPNEPIIDPTSPLSLSRLFYKIIGDTLVLIGVENATATLSRQGSMVSTIRPVLGKWQYSTITYELTRDSIFIDSIERYEIQYEGDYAFQYTRDTNMVPCCYFVTVDDSLKLYLGSIYNRFRLTKIL